MTNRRHAPGPAQPAATDAPWEGGLATPHSDTYRSSRSASPAARAAWWLRLVLRALAITMATSSLMGPLGFGLMTYRTSPTTLNQLLGSDLAVLVVGVPTVLIASALISRRHPAGPYLTAGVALYVLYTSAQVVVGQEYLRLPGNVERFFPLLLTVFLLAEAAVVMAWPLRSGWSSSWISA